MRKYYTGKITAEQPQNIRNLSRLMCHSQAVADKFYSITDEKALLEASIGIQQIIKAKSVNQLRLMELSEAATYETKGDESESEMAEQSDDAMDVTLEDMGQTLQPSDNEEKELSQEEEQPQKSGTVDTPLSPHVQIPESQPSPASSKTPRKRKPKKTEGPSPSTSGVRTPKQPRTRVRRSLTNEDRRLYALSRPVLSMLAKKGFHTFPQNYMDALPPEMDDLLQRFSEKAVKDHLTVMLRKDQSDNESD